MFIINKYYNFFKLTKVSSFIGLHYKNSDKFIKFKMQMFSKAYSFYSFWNIVLFFYKLRTVFKKLIVSKGVFSIICSETKLNNSLNFFFNTKNLVFFSYNKFLFENKYFFKKFITFKNLLLIENSKYFNLVSFVLLILNKFSRLDTYRVVSLKNQRIPILFLSKIWIKNFYWLPLSFFDLKKMFFWLFLVFNILFEEIVLFIINESK